MLRENRHSRLKQPCGNIRRLRAKKKKRKRKKRRSRGGDDFTPWDADEAQQGVARAPGAEQSWLDGHLLPEALRAARKCVNGLAGKLAR